MTIIKMNEASFVLLITKKKLIVNSKIKIKRKYPDKLYLPFFSEGAGGFKKDYFNLALAPQTRASIASCRGVGSFRSL